MRNTNFFYHQFANEPLVNGNNFRFGLHSMKQLIRKTKVKMKVREVCILQAPLLNNDTGRNDTFSHLVHIL